MKKAILILFCFAIACDDYGTENAFQIDPNVPKAIMGDGVRVRAEPNTDSDIYGAFNMGDEVFLIERTEKKAEINGRTDYWYKVSEECSEMKPGWVFGAFIGDGDQRAIHHFEKALGLEESNPEKAVIEYKSIISKYPKAAYYYGCHGKSNMRAEALARIEILECLQKDDRDYKRDYILRVIAEAVAKKEAAPIGKILDCDFSVTIGPLQVNPHLSSVLPEITRDLQKNPPKSEPLQKNDTLILYPHRDSDRLHHAFTLKERKGAWFLCNYEPAYQ